MDRIIIYLYLCFVLLYYCIIIDAKLRDKVMLLISSLLINYLWVISPDKFFEIYFYSSFINFNILDFIKIYSYYLNILI